MVPRVPHRRNIERRGEATCSVPVRSSVRLSGDRIRRMGMARVHALWRGTLGDDMLAGE